MKMFAFSLLIAAMMSVSAFSQAKGVEGAWQLTEITMTMGKEPMTMKVSQPSMYLFTKTHYSKLYIGTDKPRPILEDYSKATQEQLYTIFVDGFDASAGFYEIRDGKLTLHPTVAKSPSDMKEDAWTTYAIKITGDTITLTPENSSSGPNKKKITFKLTRIE